MFAPQNNKKIYTRYYPISDFGAQNFDVRSSKIFLFLHRIRKLCKIEYTTPHRNQTKTTGSAYCRD